MKNIKFALVFLLSPGISSAAPTAEEILSKMTDGNVIGLKNGVAQVLMSVKSKDSESREKRFVMKSFVAGDKDKSLLRFTAPSDIQGTTFLLAETAAGKEDDLHMYLPAFKRVRRVVGDQKNSAFAGSDISYADLQYYDIKNGKAVLGAETQMGGQDCYFVTITPTDKERYANVESWVRKSDFLAQQIVFKNSEGAVIKKVELMEAKVMGGKAIATQMKVADLVKERETFIKVESVDTNAKLNSAEFTPDRLSN